MTIFRNVCLTCNNLLTSISSNGDGGTGRRSSFIPEDSKSKLKDLFTRGLLKDALFDKNLISDKLAGILKVAYCSENASGQPVEQPPFVISPFDLLTFENLTREYKNVMTQDNYDGFRLEADRQITPNLQASHTLFLGTLLRDVGYIYQIGANYASDDGKSLVMAKIGLDGNIVARGLVKVNKNLEIRANTNSRLKFDNQNAFEIGADYVSDFWTASLKSAWQGTWIWNVAYTHQIVPSFSVGSELTYININGASIGSLAARYVKGDHIFTCQLTRQPNFKLADFTKNEVTCARVQYTRKVNDRLSLAAELELTPTAKDSALRAGWDYMFRHARVQGNIDSCGRIAMQAQDFSGFGVSGCIDYWNNIYRFGFMMHLLPPPPEQRGPEEMVN
ncbi:mitochondrial import receptor subunit tom40, putative [Theileria equi strain WA]|uniref:Mitochondrial import receptor subunit tom40, putative n=1 Tax=Theileria equi strain WA TaxID=1537102 RepID=L1LFL5_THEEQ|nr:mitochondrial import receptor subunit tom40, putative [Theileria equi strain WA]EKX74222.1 mitochondrial import receptor subunit tom40, putative [Theileria equi strain WA]|eukprot:XP_004833674.1 mitochondrial import receptor subunit tom40, putative [Theileria equi strain WA]